MKIAPKPHSQKPDYSQLSQAELVSLLLPKDSILAQRDRDLARESGVRIANGRTRYRSKVATPSAE